MKVVLVTKIKNLGNIGDIVDVKSGFARNFLLPYHKALPATDDYIKDFEEKKEEYLKKARLLGLLPFTDKHKIEEKK